MAKSGAAGDAAANAASDAAIRQARSAAGEAAADAAMRQAKSAASDAASDAATTAAKKSSKKAALASATKAALSSAADAAKRNAKKIGKSVKGSLNNASDALLKGTKKQGAEAITALQKGLKNSKDFGAWAAKKGGKFKEAGADAFTSMSKKWKDLPAGTRSKLKKAGFGVASLAALSLIFGTIDPEKLAKAALKKAGKTLQAGLGGFLEGLGFDDAMVDKMKIGIYIVVALIVLLIIAKLASAGRGGVKKISISNKYKNEIS